MKVKQLPIIQDAPNGQSPIPPMTMAWIMSLVAGWALNSVIAGFITAEMGIFQAALTRFAPTLLIVTAFVLSRGRGLRLPPKGVAAAAVLAVASFTQITLFHWGSQRTTGGRVALFLFSYPLIVPFTSHLLVKGERLSRQTVVGAIVAFAGVSIALRSSLDFSPNRFAGDMVELASSLTLAIMVALMKRFIALFDKWKLLFWQILICVALYGLSTLLFESPSYNGISGKAWTALAFQIVVVGGWCFISYQKILVTHPASKVSVFFLATPLLGMIAGEILRDEPFEWTLLAGCAFVAFGIWVANRGVAEKGSLKN